jgi:hypothetical protein
MMQTDAQRIQCSQQKKNQLIANQFSASEVIDCVGKLLTRHWNTWHSERHCVFTAGGERVKPIQIPLGLLTTLFAATIWEL